MIEPQLLEVLKCPIGKARLKEEGNFLVCTSCGLKFPVKDNIPVLLIEEAILPDGINSITEIKCRK